VLSVYVSGASSEWQRVASVVERLEASGLIEVPCKWWIDASQWSGRDHERSSHERIRLTRELFAAIDASDVFLLLAPSHGHTSRMAWAELGYALNSSYGLRVIVSGNYAQTICTALADTHFHTDDDAISAVISLAGEP
jgi:hypothetical protein